MKSESLNFGTTVSVNVALPYKVYYPKGYSASGEPHPLLMFLHGAGERGSDLSALTATALPKHIEDGDLDLPFVVVAPQCPEGHWWNPLAVDALLDKAIADYNIDPSRVYLTGLSMGGRGTWEMANRAGHKLAAIAPICGPFVWVNAAPLQRLPMWVFHGVMDSVVPVTESVKMVRMLRAAGCDVKFTTYADADHDSWTETYTNPELYDWLLSHRL